jgi:hypothetical protein
LSGGDSTRWCPILFFRGERFEAEAVGRASLSLKKPSLWCKKKPEENSPGVGTPYQVAILILLWIFILLWIAPLASFAAPVEEFSLALVE